MNKRKREFIDAFMKKFNVQQYGKQVDFKSVPLTHCRDYVLTEFGDLLNFKGRVNVIKGMKIKGRKNKSGKNWRSGFVVDQFYKMTDEGSKRFMTIPRSKLMLITFRNFTLKKSKEVSIFPADGNNKNLHIDNLLPFKNFMTGAKKIYGAPQSGKLTATQVRAIRRSKKSNQELADIYKRDRHTISKIRNNHTYKNVI